MTCSLICYRMTADSLSNWLAILSRDTCKPSGAPYVRYICIRGRSLGFTSRSQFQSLLQLSVEIPFVTVRP